MKLIVKNILKNISQRLSAVNIERAFNEARLIVSHILKTSAVGLIVQDDREISEKQAQEIEALVARREKFEPIAYLLGQKEFYGLPFFVTPHVLIPRPETESLVGGILNWVREKNLKSGRILDLGTGSGCIAITLAKNLGEGFQVLGLDQSNKALEVAERNALQFNLKNLNFTSGDILNPEVTGTFDIIVSNPPYIPAGEMDELQIDIKNYEPHLALVAGDDGLLFLRTILEMWVKSLSSGGLIALETHGPEQQRLLNSKVSVVGAPRMWQDGPHLFYEF